MREAVRYLRLLGFDDAPRGVDGLRALVRSHVCRVPFENLSKLLSPAPRVSTITEFLDGIEFRDLGGTCYSSNLHFAGLLRECGYDAEVLGADMSAPNVHACVRVRVNGAAYLVDAGYGAPYYEPVDLAALPLEVPWGSERHVFEACDEVVRLSEYDAAGVRTYGYVAHEPPRDAAWFGPVVEASYAPGSHFLTRLRICRFFGDHSIDLHNTRCIERWGREQRVRTIGSRKELMRVVAEEFAMPRAPLAAALEAVERNTGQALFG